MIFSDAPDTDRYLVCAYTGYKNGNGDRHLLSWSPKSLQDGGCSHAIKRHLPLARKAMMTLDSVLKSRDITLPTKVHIVKAIFFPPVLYLCENWTIKKPGVLQSMGSQKVRNDWVTEQLYLLSLWLRLTILSKEVFQIPSRKPYIDVQKKNNRRKAKFCPSCILNLDNVSPMHKKETEESVWFLPFSYS